jgi:hypothetical protein
MRIGVSTLVLLAACAGPPPAVEPPKGWTPGAPPELLALVPPDLRYVRVDIPPEQNAFTLWQRAVAAFVHVQGSPDLEAAWKRALEEDGPFPDDEDGRLLSEWLDRNREALALWMEGSRHTRCQFYPLLDGLHSLLPYLAPMKAMATAMSLRARRSVAAGDFESACEDLLATLRCGDLAIDGEGSLLHVLVGIAIQHIAIDGLRQLAARPGVPQRILDSILAQSGSVMRAGEGLATAWRVELCCCILHTVADPKGFLADTNTSWNNKAGTPEEIMIGEMMGQAISRMDRRAAVELFCQYYRRYVSVAVSPWKTRDRSVDRDAKALSKSVADIGLSNYALAAVISTGDYLFKRYILSEISAGREARSIELKNTTLHVFQRLPMPGEKALFCLLSSPAEATPKCERWCRAYRGAVRTIVALRLFVDRRGRLPDSLDDLVTEGILTAVPTDPFNDQPLRYSKERKVVWSVGADEIDDGGAIDPELSTSSKDYAWPVQ